MKDKIKANTEKLNQWISESGTIPSNTLSILKPKVININDKGSPIMSEEEFNKIMNDE